MLSSDAHRNIYWCEDDFVRVCNADGNFQKTIIFGNDFGVTVSALALSPQIRYGWINCFLTLAETNLLLSMFWQEVVPHHLGD
jgi:hypothetical protein